MFAYCENRPVVAIDENGYRTYFLNGIMNPYEFSCPDYFIRFSKALGNHGINDVKGIPVFKKQAQWSVGMIDVIDEMLNIGKDSDDALKIIEADLAANPLTDGEQLNLIGYSGGGQVALNVAEKLNCQVDNVILIGAPTQEIFSGDYSVSMLYGAFDPLMSVGVGMDMYFAGWFGHEGYFTPTNVDSTAKIVASIIGG